MKKMKFPFSDAPNTACFTCCHVLGENKPILYVSHDEDGTVSEEIKERTYDLKCNTQGRMIQVSVPATVPLKDYDYNAEVELINPVADTVANANYRGADVDWYVKADDIVLKNKGTHAGNPQNNAPQQPPKK